MSTAARQSTPRHGSVLWADEAQLSGSSPSLGTARITSDVAKRGSLRASIWQMPLPSQ